MPPTSPISNHLETVLDELEIVLSEMDKIMKDEKTSFWLSQSLYDNDNPPRDH